MLWQWLAIVRLGGRKVHIDMPITREKIKNHFHYSIWQYVLLVVVAVFFWNLLFSTTQYRTPPERKVELYAEGYQDAEGVKSLDKIMETIHAEIVPEMEEVSYRFLTLDETYAPMQLMVWASAGEGDIFLVSEDRFHQMASGGALLDLQPYIDSGMLAVEGIDISAGIVRDEEMGKRSQYGIPADSLAGLEEAGLMVKGGILSVLAAERDREPAVRVLNHLLIYTQSGE